MQPTYCQDVQAGLSFRARAVTITITESRIIDFALQFDPQPIHIDVASAREGGPHARHRTRRSPLTTPSEGA